MVVHDELIQVHKNRILNTNLGIGRFPAITAEVAAEKKNGHRPRSPCSWSHATAMFRVSIDGFTTWESRWSFNVLEDVTIFHSLQEEVEQYLLSNIEQNHLDHYHLQVAKQL